MTEKKDQQVSVLTPDLTIELLSREIPEPTGRQVLIEVRSVGVCGSDIHYFAEGRIGPYIVENDIVLGHEASGVIVGLGPDVVNHTLGQRVAIEPGVPCGNCEMCITGKYNLCPDVEFFATPPFDGAFSEYVVINENFAHPVPDNLSDNAAALIEPLSVGVWACQKAGISPGQRVLIAGAGPIGIVNAMVARERGANEIHIFDINEDRLRHAQKLGFTTSVNAPVPANLSEQFHVFLDCTGHPAAINAGFHATRPSGTVVLVGMAADGSVPLPVDLIQGKELWVTGTFRYAHTYPTAIELASSGRVDLDSLVSATYQLTQAEDALTHARRHPADLKVMVKPTLESG